MSLTVLAAVATVVAGFAALVGLVVPAITRLAKLEFKVNTMWAFQMRRAESELIQRGLGVKNSPIRVSPEAIKWMDSLATELRNFYRQLGREVSLQDLALEIEQRYGERILQEVCIPHGLFEGACLIIAAAVARGEPLPDLDVPTLNATASSKSKSETKSIM